jgi:hypothetical protein
MGCPWDGEFPEPIACAGELITLAKLRRVARCTGPDRASRQEKTPLRMRSRRSGRLQAYIDLELGPVNPARVATTQGARGHLLQEKSVHAAAM